MFREDGDVESVDAVMEEQGWYGGMRADAMEEGRDDATASTTAEATVPRACRWRRTARSNDAAHRPMPGTERAGRLK